MLCQPNHQANHAFIEAHNAKADAGNVSFWLALNRFGDLTNDEYREGLLSKRDSAARSRSAPSPPLQQGTAPDSFSWYEQGVVPPVKDQGSSLPPLQLKLTFFVLSRAMRFLLGVQRNSGHGVSL